VDPATPSVRSSLGPADEDQPHDDDQPEEEAAGERKPYWAGFESPDAFFDHIKAERAKVQKYLEPLPRRQVPAPDFPGDDEIAGSEAPAGRQAAVRQVGVKAEAG